MIHPMVEFEHQLTRDDLNWINTNGAIIGWKPRRYIEVKNYLSGPEVTPEAVAELHNIQIATIKRGLEIFPDINSEADLYFKVSQISEEERDSHPLMAFARSTAFAKISGLLSKIDLFKLFARQEVFPQSSSSTEE